MSHLRKKTASTTTSPNFLEEECLNIYWKIKNFNYCWERITSPVFEVSDKQFVLNLTPTFNAVECNVSGKKFRCYMEDNCQFSLLTSDGSPVESKSDDYSVSFSKDIIFGKRRNSFLPEDTLTIRCRIPTTLQKGKMLIQSRIGLQRKCFLWSLKNFSEIEKNNNILIENSEYGLISLDLKSVGGVNSDKQFYLQISQTNGKRCYCVLKVSVLDVNGKAVSCVSDEFIFQNEKEPQTWRYPPFINNTKLISCKSQLLPNDTLVLKCDFTTSLGTITEENTVINYCEDVFPLLKD